MKSVQSTRGPLLGGGATFFYPGYRRESVPPLHERNGDKVKGLTPAAVEALTAPFLARNVRELENKVRRGVVMTDGVHLTPEDLELAVPGEPVPLPRLKAAREKLERELVELALARFAETSPRRHPPSISYGKPSTISFPNTKSIERNAGRQKS
ncbi:hypothetical protein [Candidatus Manganitrophus noduliformans]|uniref:NorR-like AAA+ ATPase lid domain-containing protein n=1 Tax=Candidatus Manganitrophus noduliformans TaxID=2606439 RepID=A0A7X6DRQ5_9BACT|nr:hypothetical protein [Candidatus Manganitrophus noduliformans]NKE72137.1 hypothetical protein [Candidatus Manganitrophus noduliformans]